MQFILDSSYILSHLMPDEFEAESQDFFEKALSEDHKLFSPSVLTFEVGNSLRSAVLRSRISQEDALKFFRSYDNLCIDLFTVSDHEVLTLGCKYNLSFYDASYLWLAREKQAPLLTFDRKLKKIADKYLGN